jgi:hypothetical protein
LAISADDFLVIDLIKINDQMLHIFLLDFFLERELIPYALRQPVDVGEEQCFVDLLILFVLFEDIVRLFRGIVQEGKLQLEIAALVLGLALELAVVDGFEKLGAVNEHCFL